MCGACLGRGVVCLMCECLNIHKHVSAKDFLPKPYYIHTIREPTELVKKYTSDAKMKLLSGMVQRALSTHHSH